jgi:hypothetical protein
MFTTAGMTRSTAATVASRRTSAGAPSATQANAAKIDQTAPVMNRCLAHDSRVSFIVVTQYNQTRIGTLKFVKKVRMDHAVIELAEPHSVKTMIRA